MSNWDDESDGEVQKKVAPPPSIPKKSKWEGEDEEQDKVADDWDDESEEEEKPAPKAVVASAPKKKGTIKAKLAEKEAEKAARREAGLDTDEDDVEDVVDPAVRRKMEREREVAADLQHATDLLGTASIGGSKDTDTSALASANPKTKPEFEAFAKQVVASVIQKHQNKPLYASFVDALVKEVCLPLRDVEVRKSASILTALANEKQKEQKEKASGKKKPKGAAKPTLGAAKPGKVDTRVYEEALDDFGNDPDDFM
ncbi:Translation initiation factor 3 subunit J component [Tulasnella sp. 418]|nr:Translation initiation factor 3 subunit J component [Tulasnella sp. 418]